MAMKTIPEQDGADHNQIGGTSYLTAPTSLPALFSSPSKELGTCKDLLYEPKTWLFSSSVALIDGLSFNVTYTHHVCKF